MNRPGSLYPSNAKPRRANVRASNAAVLESVRALYGDKPSDRIIPGESLANAQADFMDAMRRAGIVSTEPERIAADGNVITMRSKSR